MCLILSPNFELTSGNFYYIIKLYITVVTLGLFAFVVNALVLYIVSYVVPGVQIAGLVPAILAAVVLSVVATALSMLLKDVAKMGKR